MNDEDKRQRIQDQNIEDTRFNVENLSNAKRKNHGRQPANTPHYYQKLELQRRAAAYNIISSLRPKPPVTGLHFAPLKIGLYNLQLNLEHIQRAIHKLYLFLMTELLHYNTHVRIMYNTHVYITIMY